MAKHLHSCFTQWDKNLFMESIRKGGGGVDENGKSNEVKSVRLEKKR